jgi:hypothetical protein
MHGRVVAVFSRGSHRNLLQKKIVQLSCFSHKVEIRKLHSFAETRTTSLKHVEHGEEDHVLR